MPTPPDPHLGAVLGDRYELLRPIASGGMDDVYEAADRILKRRVAIRLYPTASPADRARFEEESRVLTERDLPRVYDTGQQGDEAYLVLELADRDPATDRDATVAMALPLGADPTGEVTAILSTEGATAVLPVLSDPVRPAGTRRVPRRSREVGLWGAVVGLAVIFAAVIVFALTRSPPATPTPAAVVTTSTSSSTTTPHRATTTTPPTEVSTTLSPTTSVPDTSSTSLDPTATTFVAPPTSVAGLGFG